MRGVRHRRRDAGDRFGPGRAEIKQITPDINRELADCKLLTNLNDL